MANSGGDLDDLLPTATDSQIGGLGEETATIFMVGLEDITVVTMGDAGMPRQGGRQDLDLVAVVDGELTVFEVKTRYRSKDAGRLTRAGNLPRPRLRRPRTAVTHHQGSQAYVAQRLHDVVNTGDIYKGVNVRVIAIDLKAMLSQQFSVSDDGRTLIPIDKPSNCREAADEAFATIIDHRGHL